MARYCALVMAHDHAEQAPLRESRHRTPFSTIPSDDLPVNVQLAWRLLSLIRTGRLSPGERLPSFRQLADWAGVNVNTVRSVYARLEGEGWVVTRHGQGTFVSDEVESVPELETIANEALDAAYAAGVSRRELAIVLSASASMAEVEVTDDRGDEGQLPDVAAESEAIEVREELRRQIGRLEAALSAYVRDLPQGTAMPPVARGPRVAGVRELEQIRDALIVRLSEGQQAAEERARREAKARARREAMQRNPELHKWEAVSSEETGEEANLDYRVQPRFGPLGMAMNWWRFKVSR
jgi:DNA-binding transcriptional regulator YhcF (GntR family)